MLRTGFYIFFLGLTMSCVTNKKIQYLQNAKHDPSKITLDSAIREYTLQNNNYRIQPNDVLLIQVETLTQSEFNFLGP